MVNGHDIQKNIGFKISYTPRKNITEDVIRRSSFGQSHLRHYDFDYAYSGTDNNSSYEGFSYLKSIRIGVTNEKQAPIFDALFNTALKENTKDPLSKRITTAKKFILTTQDSVSDYLDRRTRDWDKTKLDDIKKTLANTEFRSDLNFSTPSMAVMQSKPTSGSSMTSGIILNLTMGEIANDLKEKFINVTYLGPLRSHPSRFYAPRGDQNESVGKLGENVARFIYEQSPEITEEINSWFAKFEIPYELSARSIGDNVTGTVICLQLKDTRSNVVVGP